MLYLRDETRDLPHGESAGFRRAKGQGLRFIAWLLTPVFYWLLFGLLPESSEFILAIDPLTIGLIAGGVGAAAGGITAAQASGPSLSSADRATFRRPLESGALGAQARLQALIQLGAPADTIVQDFIIQQTAENLNPANARGLASSLAQAQNALARGDTAAAEQMVANLNVMFNVIRKGSRNLGVPAQASIVDGKLKIELTGPEGAQIQALADQSDQIFRDRVQTLGNISRAGAGFPAPTAEDIEAEERQQIELQLAQLENTFGERSEQIIEQANRLGINPGRTLGELEEQRLLQQRSIETETGLSRALNLLGGQQDLAFRGIQGGQQALDPTLFGGAFQAQQLGSQVQAQGLTSGLNFANTQAQAGFARVSGIANAFNTLGSLGLFSGLLSSSNLQGALGQNQGRNQARALSF